MLEQVKPILLQYITAFCTVAVILLSTIIYLIWKNSFGRKQVNCWFCNTDSVVPFRQRNCWKCESCQQYNGFNKHGDYNEILPEMHDESMNIKQLASQSNEGSFSEQTNKLCTRCSRNQLLKVKQLSQFEPINEASFDSELKNFELRLEALYALCQRCKEVSRHYIKMQDTILHGNMLAVKRRLLPHDDSLPVWCKTKTESPAVKGSSFCAVLLLNSLQLSACLCSFAYFYLAFYKQLSQTFPLLAVMPKHYSQDLHLYVTSTGFGISLLVLCFRRQKYLKSNVVCILLWMASNFLEYYQNALISPVRYHILQLLEIYSGTQHLFMADSERTSLYVDKMSETMASLQRTLCISLMVFSWYNWFSYFVSYMKNKSQNPNQASKIVAKASKKVSPPNAALPNPSPTKENEVYSDCSMESEDENTNAMMNLDNCSKYSAPDLYGSLNALKLQDPEQCHSLFKQPSSYLTSSSLPSTLHTPPPSRSSSLLSLSSQQPKSSIYNPIERFGSTMDFAKPAGELMYQRHKAYTTVGGWSFSHHYSGNQSLASYPALHLGSTQSISNRKMMIQGNGDYVKKPLISPGKLQWRNKSQRQQVNDDEAQCTFQRGDADTSWELKLTPEPEISAHDSVSQIGDKNFPDFSDNDDSPQLHHQISQGLNLNSSSPKSTISNLTSVTMRSVETVENSRLCKWILAICLLINLILVVLLVKEVKEMRELEQWKSRSTL